MSDKPLDLDELERLAKAATPGQWQASGDDPDGVADDVRVCFVRDGVHCEWCIAIAGQTFDGEHWDEATLKRWHGDAAYIAAANPATVLALIQRLREAEAKPPTPAIVRYYECPICGPGD